MGGRRVRTEGRERGEERREGVWVRLMAPEATAMALGRRRERRGNDGSRRFAKRCKTFEKVNVRDKWIPFADLEHGSLSLI